MGCGRHRSVAAGERVQLGGGVERKILASCAITFSRREPSVRRCLQASFARAESQPRIW